MAAEDLEKSLLQLLDDVNIVQLHSVKEAVAYFTGSSVPDIIFSDIQLGDGLSFEIFVAVPLVVPVIFCTAYNEYALDAFKANGIDYILKPYSKQTLETALKKYEQLKKAFTGNEAQSYNNLMHLLAGRDISKTSSILVYNQDKIMPVKLTDIALFHLENNLTHLLTFSGKIYYPNKNLDELEKITGNYFFRANRQFLVCRKAIVDISSFFSRKLYVNLLISYKEKVIVSKGKAAAFLEWLAKAE